MRDKLLHTKLERTSRVEGNGYSCSLMPSRNRNYTQINLKEAFGCRLTEFCIPEQVSEAYNNRKCIKTPRANEFMRANVVVITHSECSRSLFLGCRDYPCRRKSS